MSEQMMLHLETSGFSEIIYLIIFKICSKLIPPSARIILGLIWTLILRYEIKGGEGGDKNAINDLLEWVRFLWQ